MSVSIELETYAPNLGAVPLGALFDDADGGKDDQGDISFNAGI